MAESFLGRLSGRGQTSKSASEKTFEVALSDEEWRQRLTSAQYQVLRGHGTERAGTSPLDKEYGPGVYNCAGCGHPLFDASTKFNSRKLPFKALLKKQQKQWVGLTFSSIMVPV